MSETELTISGSDVQPQYRFINAPLDADANFTIIPNSWLKDSRIVGNPLSILLFIRSHSESFNLTLPYTQKRLGIGRDAFRNARRKLEECGYLTVQERRFPKGTIVNGRNVGGRTAGLDFMTCDPWSIATGKARTITDESETQETFSEETATAQSGDKPETGFQSSGLTRTQNTENPGIATIDEKPDDGLTVTAKPSPVRPHLKKDQFKENQSSSSSSSSSSSDALGDIADDDDDDQFLSINERLTGSDLRAELTQRGIEPERLDLVSAAREVLARVTRRVGAPARFVAVAIANEPDRWLWTPPTAAPRRVRCTEGIHQPDPETDFCDFCGERQPTPQLQYARF